MIGCECTCQNCNLVLRWPNCNHVTGDGLGMNGLQVTAVGLERSGLPVHDAVSMGQAVRHVGQSASCSRYKKSEQRTRRYIPET